jgi:hypothetical protein
MNNVNKYQVAVSIIDRRQFRAINMLLSCLKIVDGKLRILAEISGAKFLLMLLSQKDNTYLAYTILLYRHNSYLAAHRFKRLWAFLCPGVFKVFDRVEIARQKISK